MAPTSMPMTASMSTLSKLLLNQSNVDVDSKDKDNGQTLLSLAAEKGHEAVVKLLEADKVNVDSGSNFGQTPLSSATANGHEAVVKLLLSNGVNPDYKIEHGRTKLRSFRLWKEKLKIVRETRNYALGIIRCGL